MFSPGSIALIGASDEEGSRGRIILQNLTASKVKNIFVVHPEREALLDLKSYPTILDVPGPIDLALIASPAPLVPELVLECARASVRGVLIVSTGFKEAGKEGRALEEMILDIRRKTGMRIMGPNSVGIIRPHTGLNASYLRVNPPAGNIAFISQSGALGAAILDWAISAHVGFSMFTSLGAMIDTDFGDLIDYLGGDYRTRSIMIYMDNVGTARKFMSAARGFARSKPIIIVKPGRYRESARASFSYTGSLAGDDLVYDAAFKRVGVIRVKEFSGLFNCASVLDSNNLPSGRRLAIVTNARSFGAMAVDTLIDLGGELAGLSGETVHELNTSLPFLPDRENPLDLLGDADGNRYAAAMKTCLGDRGVDGLLVIYAPQADLDAPDFAKAVAEVAHGSRKPVVAALIGGESVLRAREALLATNIPTYETPEEAVRTYLHMYWYHRNLTLLYETPSELPLTEAPPKNHLKAMLRRTVKEGRTILTEEESKAFLGNYGIPVAAPYLVRDVEAAVSQAEKIGYPVILKVVSHDITDKSAVGGVRPEIRSHEELRMEYGRLFQEIKEKAPQASILGVTVQRMVQNIDYELILGAKKDKDFGTVIIFGTGGAGTEVFRDVAAGLPPLNQTLARRLMEDTHGYAMLQGYRQKQPANMKELEQILVNLSNLIVDFPEIAEMDISPLAISEGVACALDARIVIDKDSMQYATQYPHLVISPYPTRYIMNYELPGGIEVTLRPIRPEDEPLEHEMLTTLKTETMRTRFFSVIKDITHEMLVRFCNIDYDREMAIVAEVRDGERKKIVGIGRLINDPDEQAAEYAVLVHDSFQGKGLGYKLLDVLIGIAQDKGLEEIHGTVLSENSKMLRMARKLGFSLERQAHDETTLVRLVLR
jgi:acetyltransferase